MLKLFTKIIFYLIKIIAYLVWIVKNIGKHREPSILRPTVNILLLHASPQFVFTYMYIYFVL